MPLHQERVDVEVLLKVMLLFHTLAREALHHLLRSRCLAAVNNVTPGRNHGARGRDLTSLRLFRAPRFRESADLAKQLSAVAVPRVHNPRTIKLPWISRAT